MGSLFKEIPILWFRLICCYAEALYRKIVPPAPKDLRGKLVLITGAGKGIGRALALQFAQHGMRLALWDIDEKGNEETAAKATELGVEARAYVCDITKTDQVQQAANQVRADLGDVDILVNNAGIMITKYFMDLTEAEIRRNFEINTMSHFWTVKEFLPAMLEKDSGHIVSISSMAGRHGQAMLTDYCAAKFGVTGFSEALLIELYRMKKFGVKISIVFPMGVNTNLLSSIADRIEYRDRFGKSMEPEEVAKHVVDGVRRNHFKIFCPDKMKHTAWWNLLLPFSIIPYFQEFMDTGMFPRKEGKEE